MRPVCQRPSPIAHPLASSSWFPCLSAARFRVRSRVAFVAARLAYSIRVPCPVQRGHDIHAQDVTGRNLAGPSSAASGGTGHQLTRTWHLVPCMMGHNRWKPTRMRERHPVVTTEDAEKRGRRRRPPWETTDGRGCTRIWASPSPSESIRGLTSSRPNVPLLCALRVSGAPSEAWLFLAE